MWRVTATLLITFTILQASVPFLYCNAGITNYIVRSGPIPDLQLEAFPPPSGYNAPEQVHITQGDIAGRAVIVSWVTPLLRHPDVVWYWKDGDEGNKESVHSTITSYRYYNYTSGWIHHATIKHLEYDTKYHYVLGKGDAVRQFSFTTPPKAGPDVPYVFGVIGDLGQTADSNSTLEHYLANPKKGQAVLIAGDLSYADDHPDHDQRRWDSWGRFVEKSTAYQAWIWGSGNHEIDCDLAIGEYEPYKPFMKRYHVPYRMSGSTSPLWYSVKRASAYIIVLSSYSAFAKYTPQYNWLKQELPKVNRAETPWLIVIVHSPWYNSNNYHYMEGESMRVMFESWLVEAKADVVFAGHVHSYERSYRYSNIKYNITNNLATPVKDPSAPVYITIGDGGNTEGSAANFSVPQPDYSAFREASFGHGILDIKNRTHAQWTWTRNQNSAAVLADSVWLYNRYWYPEEEDH